MYNIESQTQIFKQTQTHTQRNCFDPQTACVMFWKRYFVLCSGRLFLFFFFNFGEKKLSKAPMREKVLNEALGSEEND